MTNIYVSTVLVITIVIVAFCVPFFGYLKSMVGAFLSVTASILFPCLFLLRISGTYRNFGFETVTIVVIIVAAIVMEIF